MKAPSSTLIKRYLVPGILLVAAGILGSCATAGTSGPSSGGPVVQASPAPSPAQSAPADPAVDKGVAGTAGTAGTVVVPASATIEAVPLEPAKDLGQLVGEGNLEAALKVVDSAGALGLEDGEKQLVQAHLLMGTGDLAGARSKYLAVLSVQDQNADALFGLAMIAWSESDPKACQDWLEKAIKADPEHAAAFALLGDLYLDRQQLALAEKNYRKSLSIDNTLYEPLMGLVNILLERGKGKESLDYLDRIIRLYPDDSAAYSQRGKIWEQEGETGYALQDMDKAVELSPDSLWSYLDRGRVRFRSGMALESIADFNKVISFDPEFFMAWFYLGQAKLSRDELEPAVADFRKALSIRKDYSDVYEPYALALFGLGRFAESAVYFEKAFNPREKNERTLVMAAVSLFQAKDTKGLKDAYNRFAMLMNRDGMFYNLLRFLLEPSMEGLVINQIDKTKDAQVRAIYGFYASFPLARLNRTQAVIRLLEDARDRAPEGTLESRIARWNMKTYEQQ